jgi:putative membrane protein
MAAERTWLAWWRTALGASAGALAVGRFAPQLLEVAAWPYIPARCGYASLAVGLLIVGAHASASWSMRCEPGPRPLRFRTVGLFTVGGVALAVMTVVLVIAQNLTAVPRDLELGRSAALEPATSSRPPSFHAARKCHAGFASRRPPLPLATKVRAALSIVLKRARGRCRESPARERRSATPCRSQYVKSPMPRSSREGHAAAHQRQEGWS